MKSQKVCNNVCSLIFVLFVIVVILGCIRYYELKEKNLMPYIMPQKQIITHL